MNGAAHAHWEGGVCVCVCVWGGGGGGVISKSAHLWVKSNEKRLEADILYGRFSELAGEWVCHGKDGPNL